MSNPYQITEYSTTAAALSELRARYAEPFDVATTKGMALAKEARAVIRGYRTALEKLRVELKAPALERTRLIDAEAKRITAELLAIEEPIDATIKAEERLKEEEKAAKARAEQERITAIAARINAIRNRANAVASKSAAEIRAAMEQVHAMELAPLDFQEFLPDAVKALDETRDALGAMLIERVTFEEEQDRQRAEREELARLREAEVKRQAEQARMEAEARKVEEARLQAERERQQAELKAQREAQEAALKAQREEQQRQEQAARQLREAEEARLQAEQEAMERQRAELADRQRQMEEAEQKAQAEKFKKRGKAKADPLTDLKQALNADETTAQALDEAYQRGFQAGVNSILHVA